MAIDPEFDAVAQLVLQTIQQATPLGGDKAGVILINCYDLVFDWYIEQPISERCLIAKVPGHLDGHCSVTRLEGIFVGLNYNFDFIGGGARTFQAVGVPAPPATEVAVIKLGPAYSYTKLEGSLDLYIRPLGPQAGLNEESVRTTLSQMVSP